MKPILKTENLTHIYSAGTPFQRSAVEHVDFAVYPGEFVGVIGHTGSGKSTFIQHLNGLLKPTEGRVLFNGQDIWSSARVTHETRFHVGLVFQYPEYQLFEETVYKDIAFGPGNMGLPPEEIHSRVLEAAHFAGVPEEVYPIVAARCGASMAYPLPRDYAAAREKLEGCDAVLLGPGLGSEAAARELASRAPITSSTGWRYRREVPKSPWRAEASQPRYRSGRGVFTPQ